MTIAIPQHLKSEISSGRAVLVFGAGASITSKGRNGRDIKHSAALAPVIADAAGLLYDNEDLSDVMEAARSILGDARLKLIFETEYSNCSPSRELEALFNLSWRRIYTFNIDDAVRHVPKRSRVQNLKFYNALKDRRDEPRGYSECQVVHLHGYVEDYTSGFIFSLSDYAKHASRRYGWYERLGEDFHDYSVVFVGSQLDEPLLFQHIKAVLSSYDLAGRSYLITPKPLSPVRARSLEQNDIFHLPATLAEFSNSLKSDFPSGVRPEDIESATLSGLVGQADSYTRKDIDALRNFFPVSRAQLQRRHPVEVQNRRLIRNFFEGYGPSWPVLLSKANVRLKAYGAIQTQFSAYSGGHGRLFVVLGESGSGKSTCAMQLALEFSDENKQTLVFEYREQAGTLRESLKSLRKFVEGQTCIVLFDDFHVYADELGEIISEEHFAFVKFLSSARLSDWHARMGMQFPKHVVSAELKRFEDADIDGIIAKVLENLPVPAFKKLSPEERRLRLQKSKKQLLIALKEATESRGFTEIIDDEFATVRHRDARSLFYLVGVPTVARSGILPASAETIYSSEKREIPFGEALKNHLSGMVDIGNSGRLVARHEVYAKHIIDNGDFREIVDALRRILDYFARYETPVIRHISKLDGQLFKYILNNKSIYDLYSGHGNADLATEFFESFAVTFQLDGHFWLQYGLLLRRLGKQGDAYDRLLKSVQAYPGNEMAHHALAQQKLIAAGSRAKFDDVCRRLIEEGVSFLLERHYGGSPNKRIRSHDEYPIVTLANYHIDTLNRHDQKAVAQQHAKKYFKMIQDMERSYTDEPLASAKAKLLTFSVAGVWEPLQYRRGAINFID